MRIDRGQLEKNPIFCAIVGLGVSMCDSDILHKTALLLSKAVFCVFGGMKPAKKNREQQFATPDSLMHAS